MEITVLTLMFLALIAVGALIYWRTRPVSNQDSLNALNSVLDARLSQNRADFELQMRNVAESVLMKSQAQFVEQAQHQLTAESVKLKATLSEEQLKQKALMDLAHKSVESLVKPLADQLQQYKKQLDETEALRNKDVGSLGTLLKTLADSHQQLKSETTNLVHALKRPTVRGRWGEMQLRRIVELAGMSSHCDFTEQTSVTTDAQARLRPDMVVKLPNGRQIVVDSKAVLSGYLEAEEATDDVRRKEALVRHAQAIRTQITELSRKAYWEQFENAPEFVVLFVPGETFLSAAVEVQPDLVELGFEHRVVLATPTTLIALLKAVAYGWKQEQLAENARLISEQASKLYGSLTTWTEHLSKVGKGLESANKAYNESVGSLERNVLVQARKMKELGVSAKTELTELDPIESLPREITVKI